MVAHHSTAAATDYGAPVATTNQRPTNKLHRPLTLANHVLHWISSLIVLGIAAYLISKYRHNTHMRYWVAVVSSSHVSFLIGSLVLQACNIAA
jgi:hypothetical protein